MTISDATRSEAAPPSGKARRTLDPAMMALGVVLAVTTVTRLTIAADRPFWLDEVWTAMKASQPSVTEFVRQCVYDINAPLYYVIAALWAQVAGLSDMALRTPAMAFGVLGPLIALLPRRLMGRTARYVWCALLACWIPGLMLTLEARYYSLSFLLAVANTVAYAAVLKSPTQARAWAWTGVSALMILSHYYGFILAGVQGLVYLFVCRERAVKTWPAALGFLPAFASLAIHATRLTLFSKPGVAWIPLVRPGDIIPTIGFMIGAEPTMAYLLLWAGAAIYFGRKAGKPAAAPTDAAPETACLWIAVACAAGAAAFALTLGLFKPMFISRYLIGFTPGVLLGLALLAERFGRSWPRAPAFLVVAYFGIAVKVALTPIHNLTPLSFEAASNDLMTHAPKRLVFMWDNPNNPEESALRGLGGFFFARAGRPVDVIVVRARPEADPNVDLLQHATAPDTVILWIYDQLVAGTAAIRYPPRIPAIDPRWHCRNYGVTSLGVVACNRAK